MGIYTVERHGRGDGFGIDGPGNRLGWDPHSRSSERTFTDQATADKVADLMNLAYAQGRASLAREFNKLLGVYT